MNLTQKAVLCILLASAGSPVIAQEIKRSELSDLFAECELHREQKIAPLRKEAVEECVTGGSRDTANRSREECEERNANFGRRNPALSRPGMFWDLPACQRALDAERYFKMNPGRDSYVP